MVFPTRVGPRSRPSVGAPWPTLSLGPFIRRCLTILYIPHACDYTSISHPTSIPSVPSSVRGMRNHAVGPETSLPSAFATKYPAPPHQHHSISQPHPILRLGPRTWRMVRETSWDSPTYSLAIFVLDQFRFGWTRFVSCAQKVALGLSITSV